MPSACPLTIRFSGQTLCSTGQRITLWMRRFFGVSQLVLQICRPFAVTVGILQSKLGLYIVAVADADP